MHFHRLGAPRPKPREAAQGCGVPLSSPSPPHGLLPRRSSAPYRREENEVPQPPLGRENKCKTHAHPRHHQAPKLSAKHIRYTSLCLQAKKAAPETLLRLTAGSWRPTYTTSQNSFIPSRPSVPKMLGVPALLRPEGFQVPRRGGASRSLRTQARSPGNIQLRSVRQWERARGSRSKVNGRPRLRRRGRNCEGLARSPGPLPAPAHEAPAASRKLPRHAAGGASVCAGASGSRGLRLAHLVGRRPQPWERWGLAAADYLCKKHS